MDGIPLNDYPRPQMVRNGYLSLNGTWKCCITKHSLKADSQRNIIVDTVYEGDIVEAFSQGVKGTFEVKWRQEGSPSWILFPAWQSSQMWYLHAVGTEKGYYKDNITVIGNRYENPELLKEEPTC